jgi:ABC-type uncharacterized transport system substrate-binding protein
MTEVGDQRSVVSKSDEKNSMNKRVTRIALCTMLLALSFPAGAQQSSKIPTIGWLTFRPLPEASLGTAALRRELRALGYIEGKNIAIVYRSAEGRPERFPTLADELVRLKVDVLLTPGTPATLARLRGFNAK